MATGRALEVRAGAPAKSEFDRLAKTLAARRAARASSAEGERERGKIGLAVRPFAPISDRILRAPWSCLSWASGAATRVGLGGQTAADDPAATAGAATPEESAAQRSLASKALKIIHDIEARRAPGHATAATPTRAGGAMPRPLTWRLGGGPLWFVPEKVRPPFKP